MAVEEQRAAPALEEGSPYHAHADLANAVRLLSIGIDIGSATTHFAISELYVGKRDPRMAEKPQVLHRHLLHQSRVFLTPFRSATSIDVVAIEHFLRGEAEAAGFHLEDLDTGVLICTGEAARKSNAAAISEHLAAESGRFVCATAGHHLEAVLGAHGSGALQTSRGRRRALILLDIGGGTAKLTVMQNGRILQTAAMNVGARLIALDEQSRVARLEHAGALIAAATNCPISLGDRLDETDRARIAGRMAACLAQLLGLAPMDELSKGLLLTDAPTLPREADLMLAGGLAEYFYGREHQDFHDLGVHLSNALRQELDRRGVAGSVLPSECGMRATVIGAGQFTVQVSGDTVFLDGGLSPPLRAVPVRAIPLDWSAVEAASVQRLLASALADCASDGPCGLAFPAPASYGYGAAQRLADALGTTLPRLSAPHGIVLVFQHNVARTVGTRLAALGVPQPFMCIDELEVGDLEYLDIGEPVGGEDFLPVVVKSLVFSGPTRPGHAYSKGHHNGHL